MGWETSEKNQIAAVTGVCGQSCKIATIYRWCKQREPATSGKANPHKFSNPAMNDFESDWSLLHDAAFNGHLLSLHKLIAKGYSVNLSTLDRVTPLHGACLQGHVLCAKHLIENGANVNVATVDWNTPLFNACSRGNTACVNLLLQKRAEPQGANDLASPIHEAAKHGHTDCIELLVKHGADIDYQVKHLGSPLYVACLGQHLESVTKLLQSGANVNSGKHLDSPLHAAAQNSRPDFVRVLLAHDADVNVRNAEGKQPRDLAPPNSDVEKLLRQGEGPTSLMQICRRSIRKDLGRARLSEVFGLPIPAELKHFLLYK